MAVGQINQNKVDVYPWIMLFFLYLTLTTSYFLYNIPGLICIE